MASISIQGNNRSTSSITQRNGVNVLEETFKGNFLGTEVESQIDFVIPTWPYRAFDFTIIASSWGSATVTIKIYPCDSDGTIDSTNTNPFFSVPLTANTTVRLFLTEMGGAVTAATYPPASPAAAGSVVGTFGSSIKLTETCSAFVSGTNTVTIKVRAK
jgi:hypothetical protein